VMMVAALSSKTVDDGLIRVWIQPAKLRRHNGRFRSAGPCARSRAAARQLREQDLAYFGIAASEATVSAGGSVFLGASVFPRGRPTREAPRSSASSRRSAGNGLDPGA
jgi:hypothetical protein